MYSTRKKLILSAGIISLIDAVFSLVIILLTLDSISAAFYDVLIGEFDYNVILSVSAIFKLLLMFQCLCALIAGILNIVVGCSKTEEIFKKRKATLIAGTVFTVLSGALTIPAILIYISYGIKNKNTFTNEGSAMYQGQPQNIAPQNNIPQNNISYTQVQRHDSSDFNEKVNSLRKLKEDGLISDEDFKELFKKLL